MTVSRRWKASPAARRTDQLRQARAAAPTLRTLQPTATQVALQLTFAEDARLVHAPRTFTVYPAAQAHFVYACAFGDCDGMHDLDTEIFDMLRVGTCQIAGVRLCVGQMARRSGHGPRCGLGLAYAVTVGYETARPAEDPWPALTL
jgi:hypothetical protein